MSSAPATRALARLAWRELRRRPGRSLLVIALVAMPVAALAVAAILYVSSAASPQDQRRSVLGGADVAVVFAAQDATNGDTVADVLRRLPQGSRVVRVREAAGLVPVRDRNVFVEVSDLRLNDPLAAGMTKLVRGRAPLGRGEVAASPAALRDLGLRLGDTLVSRSLGLRAQITAEVIDPTQLSRRHVHSGAGLADTSSRTARLLVALPPGTAAASAIKSLRGSGREVKTVANCCPDQRPAAREFILAISGLALFVVGLVVAAAFAVGARRQLRTIGLLSAAAGADERHIRRLAVLQGTLCGVAGVIAGFALAAAVVATVIAPNLDDLAGHITSGVSVPPVELALIAGMAILATGAGAWLPGRTAAHIPILAALAGHAPLRPVSATLPVRGLAISALGTAVLTAGLNDHGPRGLTLTGAVLIVLGFVLCAPALVGVLDGLATRARGTTRLAARDIARQRARTGPLVAAILAVVSLAVLGSTLIGAINAFHHGPGQIVGPDEVLLSTAHPFSNQHEAATVSTRLRARTRALLPRAAEAQIAFHQRRDANAMPRDAVVHLPNSDIDIYGVAIGGPQLLDFLGAGAARSALDRGDVVALRTGLIKNGHVTIAVPQPRGRTRDVRVPATEARVDRPNVSVVISSQTAARLGLTPTTTDILFRTPNALTAQQRHALQALAIGSDRSAAPHADATILIRGNLPDQGLVRGLHEAMLMIAAALTLAVVASGLALSTAEGKPDDTMLVALGADPQTRRRLRATQAGLLVAIGGLLALPAGLIPATAFILNSNEMRFAVPWTVIAVVLLALPAAAAAGAWLLTRPAQWSPPTTWAD